MCKFGNFLKSLFNKNNYENETGSYFKIRLHLISAKSFMLRYCISMENKFLGTTIKCNGDLKHSSYELSKKVDNKILFSIHSLTSSLGNLPIEISSNLFDFLVKPVLTYI